MWKLPISDQWVRGNPLVVYCLHSNLLKSQYLFSTTLGRCQQILEDSGQNQGFTCVHLKNIYPVVLFFTMCYYENTQGNLGQTGVHLGRESVRGVLKKQRSGRRLKPWWVSSAKIRHSGEDAVRRYQTMLAARQEDPQVLAAAYRNVAALVLSIDGLQPEKGHETLYVVRELNAKRLWFAEALLSSSADEVRRLLMQARAWATRLGLPVHLWLSDKQDAFVTGIAADLPGSRIGMALIIFCATWPSPCWRRIVTPRSRCAAQSAGCVPLNVRCCSNGASPASPPLLPLPLRRLRLHPWRTRWPRTHLPRPTHLRMLARSCWITVAPCVAYSMTIRADRANHRAYAWWRPWKTSVLRSNVTWIPTVAAARTPNSSAWPPVSTEA